MPKNRTKEISERLVPEGMVAIPIMGHQFAGWTVSDNSTIAGRPVTWFIGCAKHLSPRVLKKFIKKHHQVVSIDEHSRRSAFELYQGMAPSPYRDEVLKRYA